MRRGGARAWLSRAAIALGVTLGVTLGVALAPHAVAAQDQALFARAMDLGFEARRRGDVEEAVRSFRRAVAADSTSARAHFELGYALLQTPRRAEAAAAFEEGLRRDPSYVDAHRQLGYLRSALGQPRESIAAFEAARALGVTDLRDRLEVGVAAQRAGDRALAERALGEAAAASDTAIANAATRALAGTR